MSEKITVVGAGMAGLLAAAMLRSDCRRVIEVNEKLPNNHSAVLRFRSSLVGDTLGIPFKKVKVLKDIVPWKNRIADALSYSFKANGTYTLRSSVTARGDVEERYIAPLDFISRMENHVHSEIQYGSFFVPEDYKTVPVISTMPMPALMKLLGWKHAHRVKFGYVDGYNINATLPDVDAYCTLYIPNPDYKFSRISLTGRMMTIECPKQAVEFAEMDEDIKRSLKLLGLSTVKVEGAVLKKQQYAKILPIDDDLRKQFILWASQAHGIYSLGRFATWRPGLLLDDVVNDVRVIQRLINKGHSYDQVKG
jgi:hypothetical protein